MSLCFLFSNVVIEDFLRSVLFGFDVVVEAESGRALAGHPCTSIAPELIVTNLICLLADYDILGHLGGGHLCGDDVRRGPRSVCNTLPLGSEKESAKNLRYLREPIAENLL